MAVVKFTFDPALTEWFVRFGYSHYSGDTRWIPPLKRELYTQLAPTFPFYRQPGNAHQHFLAFSGRKIVGRVSAMVNQDFLNNGGTPVGTLGFFECVDDYAVAQELLDTATAWLREQHQIRRVWGPMNFDIWHNYRFMTKGFDQGLFCGEPYNKPYYPEFFERYGFQAKHCWDSLEVSGLQTLEEMIVRGAKRYKLLTDRGYRFEPFNKKHPARPAFSLSPRRETTAPTRTVRPSIRPRTTWTASFPSRQPTTTTGGRTSPITEC